MIQKIVFTLISATLVFLIDWYVFQAVRTVTQNLSPAIQKTIHFTYWAIFAITVGTLALASATRGTPPNAFKTYLASTLFIIFACKLVVALFLLADDGIRLAKWLAQQLNKPAGSTQTAATINRSQFLSKLALVAGAIPFTAFIYGMVKGAYDYQVKKVTLRFPNLPQAFDGFKMLQISDLHTGSFQSSKPLERAVKLINQQEADVVFFTGDLVNNVASELEGLTETLGKIKAKMRVFSVLGNHDYGDYVTWSSHEEKAQNLLTLKNHQQNMGWHLLLNQNFILDRNGQQLAILGVENWGRRMGFPRYGDLAKAHAGTEDVPFKVLLSHDPSHWDGQVNKEFPDIDLMLSGHTHGMQFGVNLPNFKWSPVQYVYEQWAGLYQKGNQYLYVNTGLGFIGYPGRVGFLPEITVFELKRS
ncbi:MAG: metallophosphoesterase [Hymenobacteraceae bacterium]|nr:metallophosphoesterase [Hymenobacteraceae bacterium]MDX5394738.1 metallophosphoesterase [Hymenobacteraceae bacterium]MDX5510771.1 metallophosphoesterase [Hymenobacteraceae bacterium]